MLVLSACKMVILTIATCSDLLKNRESKNTSLIIGGTAQACIQEGSYETKCTPISYDRAITMQGKGNLLYQRNRAAILQSATQKNWWASLAAVGEYSQRADSRARERENSKG